MIDVEGFICQNYSECRKKPEQLQAAVTILDHLLTYRDDIAHLYPRQIPHGQSTKIIGYESLLLRLYRHHILIAHERDVPLDWDYFYRDFQLKHKPISFQFFSDQIYWDNILLRDVHALISNENVQRWGLDKTENVLIVENEESFFPLHGNLSGWLIILGSGKMICGADFLQAYLHGNIYYWGDIDKDGYEIYASAQDIFHDLIPIGMGMDTLQRYQHLNQSRAECEPRRKIPLLDDAYRQVCQQGIRIEQEQIDLNEIISVIQG